MIDAHVAQNAGAHLHALHEFLGQASDLVVGQAGDAQPFHREADIGRNPAGRESVRVGRRLQRAEKGRDGGGRLELHHQQAAVIDVGVGRQDSALHIRGIGERRRFRNRVGQLAARGGLGRNPLDPADGFVEAPQSALDAQLIGGIADHRHEFRQKFVRGAQQYVAVVRAVQINVGQAMDAREHAHAMAKRRTSRVLDFHFLFETGAGRVARHAPVELEDRTRRDLFRRRNAHARRQQFAMDRLVAGMDAFGHLQVSDIVDGDVGRRIEEGRFALRRLQPLAPFLVAVLVAEHIVFGIAEDEIEKPRHLLPDHAHIGFPRAVEGYRQQNLVVAVLLVFEHDNADRVNAADAFHRVRENAEQFVLVRIGTADVQGAQHPLDARLVGHGVERRHEAFFYRRQHAEIGGSRKSAGLDGQIAAHAGPPETCVGRSRLCVDSSPNWPGRLWLETYASQCEAPHCLAPARQFSARPPLRACRRAAP